MERLTEESGEGKVIAPSNSLPSSYGEINAASPCEAALIYAEMGYYVFPVHYPAADGCSCGKVSCTSIGKHPMITGPEQKATKDPAQIREWWTKWPQANIGIAVGRSGLMVLDVDPDKGGRDSLQELQAIRGTLPQTTVSQTGGGGDHWLFKQPDVRIGNKVGILPGLDIRGDGGFIVAPTSAHRTGNKYQWIKGRDPVDVPSWLLDLLKGHRGANGSKIDPEEILAGLSEGERDGKLFRWLCRIARSPKQGDLEAIAIMAQERVNQDGHPFTREDALAKARQAYGYREGDLPEIVEENGLEIWDCCDPEPKWIFQDFLKVGCALLGGQAKTGKSWIVLEMALSIVLNRPCFSKFAPAEQGEVLYIDLEDSKINTKGRLRSLLSDNRDPRLANLRFVRRWPTGDEALVKLDDYLSGHPATKMVVIDTLVGIRKERKKDQDLYDYDYKVITGFRELADRYGITIIIVHHFNKSRQVADVFDKFSGSTGIQAAPHTLIAYEAKRGDGAGIVHVTGKRSSEVRFALKRDANERPIWQDAGEFQTSKERLAIIMELREAYPAMLSRGDLAELLEAKKATISKRLHAMVRDGQIIREGDGNMSRYTVARGMALRPLQNHEPQTGDDDQQQTCENECPDF